MLIKANRNFMSINQGSDIYLSVAFACGDVSKIGKKQEKKVQTRHKDTLEAIEGGASP